MINLREIFLCLLIATFATGSWIDLNGVWVELPLLVNRLPEGWKLPTYVVLVVQLANIAPILYLTLQRKTSGKDVERYAIYIILLLGSVCCLLLSRFWDNISTIYVAGKSKQSSIAFLVLISILSIVDTTSSVTFLPYLVNYPSKFITALYVGEGFSGLIPGIAGMIQGNGGEPQCHNFSKVVNSSNQSSLLPSFPAPRFSVSTFFQILCSILLLCLLSFALLDNLAMFKNYRIRNTVSNIDIKSLLSDESVSLRFERKDNGCTPYVFILLVGYINFLTNGVLPSIQNYTLMPYSNTLYHYVVTISQIINPLACLITLKTWNIKNHQFFLLTMIASVFSAYLLILASNSPNQALGLKYGSVVAAVSWFVVGSIFSFLKTTLAIEIQKKGHFWLQMCGISTQIGSALGALVIFIFVAIVQVFKSKAWC